MVIGRTVVRAILFPYGNKIVTRYLDNQMNERFGLEFGKILERTHQSIKDHMVNPAPQTEDIEIRALGINSGRPLYYNL